MIDTFINGLLELTKNWSYFGVFFLMILESSLFPVPSELVILPAAYLAQKGEMSLSMIVFAGTMGSFLGASMNYYLALRIGRPLAYKIAEKPWARFFLLSHAHLAAAEKYFLKHGKISTFIGRLIIGVRHLISLPAGFVRMKYFAFSFYTILGSFCWVFILAIFGYFFGEQEELFRMYYKEILLILFALAVIFAFYFYFRKRAKFGNSK